MKKLWIKHASIFVIFVLLQGIGYLLGYLGGGYNGYFFILFITGIMIVYSIYIIDILDIPQTSILSIMEGLYGLIFPVASLWILEQIRGEFRNLSLIGSHLIYTAICFGFASLQLFKHKYFTTVPNTRYSRPLKLKRYLKIGLSISISLILRLGAIFFIP